MKKNRYSIKKICIGVLLLGILMLITACSGKGRVYPETYEELDGLRAGAMTGSIHEEAIQKNFPNSPIVFFNTKSDLLEALIANKIDYFVNTLPSTRDMLAESDKIKMIDTSVFDNSFAFIFKKDDPAAAELLALFNGFIAESMEDGTLENLQKLWVDDAEVTAHPPAFEIPSEGENGILTLATSTSQTPYSFIYNGQVTGFDIQFASLFCEAYGYGLQISDSTFSSVIPAVSSGKADFGGACITMTEERAKSIDFSEPYSFTGQYPVVANREASTSAFADGFRKTFLVENRWKLVLDGLFITFLIFFSSALFGTILGFGLFLLCRRCGKLFNNIVDKISWVFSGIPMVVILMILYYVIFGKSSLSGTLVATIAFTVSILLGVNSKLITAVKSIDPGQVEGAMSLGFTDRQTLFRFILPQAMTQFMPNYISQIIDMIKGTAIVGYIAVQDLTKASDIIRSRTYEAFFPLLATALIYLLVILLSTAVLRKLLVVTEAKNRSDEQVLRRFGK